nr:MAG TPA: hypothetical protein [Caudoviricetes sp.]DAX71725.1 MAG TPA: hypothetical protein [Caudoviricetes sp.]DAY19389.1 MAG TPA: hypothetical protein [Caudoviricetes sp.]
MGFQGKELLYPKSDNHRHFLIFYFFIFQSGATSLIYLR